MITSVQIPAHPSLNHLPPVQDGGPDRATDVGQLSRRPAVETINRGFTLTLDARFTQSHLLAAQEVDGAVAIEPAPIDNGPDEPSQIDKINDIADKSLRAIEKNLHRALYRAGIPADKVMDIVRDIMADAQKMVDAGLSDLANAADPIAAAKDLMQGAFSEIASSLGRVLDDHGFDSEQIGRVTHHVMGRIPHRVDAALSDLDTHRDRVHDLMLVSKKALEAIEHNLTGALHKLGFDDEQATKMVRHVMGDVTKHVKAGLAKLGNEENPIAAVKDLMHGAFKNIKDNLAHALGHHGYDREQIHRVSHNAMGSVVQRFNEAFERFDAGHDDLVHNVTHVAKRTLEMVEHNLKAALHKLGLGDEQVGEMTRHIMGEVLQRTNGALEELGNTDNPIAAAKELLHGALKEVVNNLAHVLEEHGYERVQIKRATHNVIAGIPDRVEAALNELKPHTDPVDAAKQLVDKALERIEHKVADVLHDHGYSREEITRVTRAIIDGIQERVQDALDQLPNDANPVQAARHLVDKVLDFVHDKVADVLRENDVQRVDVETVTPEIVREITVEVRVALGPATDAPLTG